MSIEDIIKQIDEERRKKYDQIEQKERQLKQTALANIRAVIGERKNDNYSFKEIEKYIIKKFNAKPITAEEMKRLLCFQHMSVVRIIYDVSYYPPYDLYSDLPLHFYSLPVLGLPGVSGHNATVVILNDENGMFCGWWVGFNVYGYDELIMLLDTLCRERISPIQPEVF